MLRTSLAIVVLTGSFALAQAGDEWNSFPPKPQPPQPATQTPTSQTPAIPARPPPPTSTRTAPSSSAPARPATASRPGDAGLRASTPDAGVSAKFAALLAEADGGQVSVLAQEERYLPGTEPHSPSTWGNAWNAPENGRVTVGQVGLGHLYVPSARLGPAGIVRVSFLGEYLNLTDFPVRSAQDIRSAVTFAASFQPFSWGEVFLSYGAAANTSNRTSPNLVQTLGDFTLGIKAGTQLFPGFHGAVDLRLLTFSGVGNQGVDRFALGFRPSLLGTYDFRRLSSSLPVLLTVAVGATLDSTGGLVVNQRLSAAEEFALDINRYHRLDLGVAIELPFPIVSPFVEYGFALPLGVTSLTGPDGASVTPTDAMHQALGVGLKVTVVKDLTLLVALDVGLARSVGLGIAATPPWNLCVGAAFAIDPFQRGEIKLVDTIRERRAPGQAVSGVVTDAETGQPVSGVVIAISGAKPSATDAKGEYQTLNATGPKVTLVASRDGYKTVEREVGLEAGKPTRLDLALEAELKRAVFTITTTAAKKPVKAAVAFVGAGQDRKVETADGATEPISIELPAGQYVVTATADGYLSQTREVQVTPGATLPVAFELVVSPKKSLVVFKGDKIDVLQQVHFATGKATILADSYNLLQQVADVVIKNNVKLVKVEGHTDNRGDRAVNQALSEARARAVADFLVSQGFERHRVESVGYGDTKPIAPNLTARGRELNRRVEFIVVDK